MDCVFLIGLPTQLRGKLENAAKAKEIYISSVVAGIGKEGTLQLFPSPEDAVYHLKAYYDRFGDRYEDAYVLVLPYAPIPSDLDGELQILEELGAEVVFAVAGGNGWPPPLKKKAKPDNGFLNAIYAQVSIEIFGEEDRPPSDYLKEIADRHSHIIITKGSLDTCDQVATNRREFLRSAANAFNEFVNKKGQVGRIDAFFRDFGLDHAQSGGISTTLTVLKDGKRVYHKTTNTHLKQGDHTTPQAAARIYFQEFFIENECYVAILYAGPHPEDDITRSHELT